MQVISNLLSNVIEFTAEGPILVSVEKDTVSDNDINNNKAIIVRLSDGYIALSALRFISAEDMKQILTLISITKIFSHSSKPFICGILISTKIRS